MSDSPRVCIITGGSRGLGASFVEAFLQDGDIVATCSRSSTPAIEKWAATHGDRFYYEPFDMRDRPACVAFVKNIAKKYGQIDVLVNNAGLASESLLATALDDDIDAVIDINLKSTLHMTRLVVRRMLVRRSGIIINISSIIGISGYRGLSVYGATKAALDGFTRALARELGARGITVNSIAPGYLRTEMTDSLVGDQLGQIERRTPLGRLGEPEDVVGMLRFLCSPEASFITGQVIVIDGGITA
ncbi:MAG: 3-oxoacyl-[acyl-carrier protein] reductase [Actinomycetota bacterium]